MFKKVLLAVDGSVMSQKAVEWAVKAYKENTQTHFQVVYCYPPYYSTQIYADGYVPDPDMIRKWEEEQQEVVLHAIDQFPDQERLTYMTIRDSKPIYKVLCAEVEKEGYDVIVLGSQGHGVVNSVLVGSVSSKVLHQAPCSVLIIK